jgi:hypothetical protein
MKEDLGLQDRLKNGFIVELDENNNISLEKWIFFAWDRLFKNLMK